MKVSRFNRGYTIHASETEYEILCQAVKLIDPSKLSSGQRRSLARRIASPEFPYLRVDHDYRTDAEKEYDNV